jgi:hypothetical protein
MFYLVKQQDKKKFEEFSKKLMLLKEGMSEEEVVKLLGKPIEEDWVDTSKMTEEIRTKYKRLYRLTYAYPGLIKFNSGICREIYLDKKGGRVLFIVLVIDTI